jgi:hypothetical protein
MRNSIKSHRYLHVVTKLTRVKSRRLHHHPSYSYHPSDPQNFYFSPTSSHNPALFHLSRAVVASHNPWHTAEPVSLRHARSKPAPQPSPAQPIQHSPTALKHINISPLSPSFSFRFLHLSIVFGPHTHTTNRLARQIHQKKPNPHLPHRPHHTHHKMAISTLLMGVRIRIVRLRRRSFVR